MNKESRLDLQSRIALSLERAQSLLDSNPGGFISTTNSEAKLSDNFFPLLVLETTGDCDLVTIDKGPGPVNFFRGPMSKKFPCDLDTTSIALTVLPQTEQNVDDIMDEMLNYRSEEGIFQVYFDHTRVRIEPTVCANILSLFASYQRLADPEVAPSLEFVFDTLESRAYLPNGTRYYPIPEAFLYFVGRFIRRSDIYMPAARIGQEWNMVLRDRVIERMGVPCSPLALAMRIMLCKQFSLPIHSSDLKSLLDTQSPGGGWKEGWLCGYPSTGVNIENVGFTTAVAIQALEYSADIFGA